MDEQQTQQQESHGCFCMGAGPQMSQMMQQLLPDAARDHFRNARLEVLKGLRSLIDQRIADLSRHEKKGTTVVIE